MWGNSGAPPSVVVRERQKDGVTSCHTTSTQPFSTNAYLPTAKPSHPPYCHLLRAQVCTLYSYRPYPARQQKIPVTWTNFGDATIVLLNTVHHRRQHRNVRREQRLVNRDKIGHLSAANGKLQSSLIFCLARPQPRNSIGSKHSKWVGPTSSPSTPPFSILS
jgi:hypothetical protein